MLHQIEEKIQSLKNVNQNEIIQEQMNFISQQSSIECDSNNDDDDLYVLFRTTGRSCIK